MLNKIFFSLLFVASLLYPFALWQGYGHFPSLLLFFIWTIKMFWELRSKQTMWKISGIFALFFIVISCVKVDSLLPMLYPFFINFGLSFVFYLSMRNEAIITYFARLEHSYKKFPELTLEEIAYTRFLNCIWIGVFIWNAFFSLFLVFLENRVFWAFYSGIGGYILMGIVFFGERLCRKQLKEYFYNESGG